MRNNGSKIKISTNIFITFFQHVTVKYFQIFVEGTYNK